MAADAPLSQLVLAATSVADDLGYVALADLSTALLSDRAGDERFTRVRALMARVLGTG